MSCLCELPFFCLDNEEFKLALFEQHNGRLNFDVDRLFHMKLNPLLSELQGYRSRP